ncbi:ShlB/FhaC/HecB family hemolysin secretion/activation protein [Nodularia sphaerocarpa]|uniref:ShlB/FhaC/HecB family hemolysin secretion/activation protein n=1 Tax=Nodularia sphaerocarpa TaxID=137816 RepID=UPI001EFBF9A9|nr:ShlB/FhaC/HecB family hemolysin secretion/activation protein [Nodularia sphaerocarpa]MDB9373356.1 ShlB/FhaC/HecB family hemolysin secretion/activation protein [Nodularia sphaerocarpa CS-585]MDB9378812.1 ShlB/FhaC/HecB family hemolysin secretion/activation protein [Nodularia sphaerocarpa CS-585A2]ULP71946.1 Heme/hemopexin transporter protein HuxB [Nodularia sphaerocarpa UHCC 0038]
MNKKLEIYQLLVSPKISNPLHLLLFATVLLSSFTPNLVLGQTPTNPPIQDIERQLELQTPITPILPKLPDIDELFQSAPTTTPTPPTSPLVPTDISSTITVQEFEVVGSTVFSQQEFDEITKEFINQPLTFPQLSQVTDKVTGLYTKGCQPENRNSDIPCYVNSGAYIPSNQTFQAEGGKVKIQIVEGGVESIEITGTKRLNPDYVRSRLAIATGKPLNLKKLFQALQLLQLDPLISSVSTELAAGVRPGGSILSVQVAEAKTLSAQISLNNNRTPSIGSFERKIQVNQANLLGFGDGLSVGYANTDGSNSVNLSYQLPVNPRNGTLQFNYSYASSEVIEEPFNVLDIAGTSQEYSITFRQPLLLTPTKEFALGMTATRRESDVGFLEAQFGERLPFTSPGSDQDGKTKASVVRFFQDWTQRSSNQVIAARSQFSVGINALDATINQDPPDGQFFAWRGQAQLSRLLAPETLFLVRTNMQIADRPLLPSEQIGFGGQFTVRGYRQDEILADNGFLATAELRYPMLRVPSVKGVLQVIPFVDFGTAWNNSQVGRTPLSLDTIASVGLGLLWQQDNRLTARFDWGIPLGGESNRKNTWQENGFYFSILYNQPF